MNTNPISRDELRLWLDQLYGFEAFEDYCHNGLQVEGRCEIRSLVLGVSLNGALIQAAINRKADAIVVHHGFFGRDFFRLTGVRHRWVSALIGHEISLFGIHLPMDAHPLLGHNARLMAWLGAGELEPLGPGFMADNEAKADLYTLLSRLETQLPAMERQPDFAPGRNGKGFSLETRHGFQVLANGPQIPRRLAVVSGASADLYETAVSRGADAFFTGEIKEHIPALSMETRTHFIHLGHYRSEIPGILALRDELISRFGLAAYFVDIPNPV